MCARRSAFPNGKSIDHRNQLELLRHYCFGDGNWKQKNPIMPEYTQPVKSISIDALHTPLPRDARERLLCVCSSHRRIRRIGRLINLFAAKTMGAHALPDAFFGKTQTSARLLAGEPLQTEAQLPK